MKIQADFRLFASAHFDAARYVPSPAAGVQRFLLDRVGSERARATTIVEYQPRSRFPEHEHYGGEEFLVLQGTFKDQYGEFPAGTYVRNPIGSKHAPWVDEDGCTIWVKLLQMADTTETTPLYVHLDQAKLQSGQATAYGTVLDLYRNPMTGEHVQMCWLDADQILPLDDEGEHGGEELFIMDGSLRLGPEEYGLWGWLRFPVGAGHADRPTLQAGAQGAQVYRKTNHLTVKALDMEKVQIKEEEDDEQ